MAPQKLEPDANPKSGRSCFRVLFWGLLAVFLAGVIALILAMISRSQFELTAQNDEPVAQVTQAIQATLKPTFTPKSQEPLVPSPTVVLTNTVTIVIEPTLEPTVTQSATHELNIIVPLTPTTTLLPTLTPTATFVTSEPATPTATIVVTEYLTSSLPAERLPRPSLPDYASGLITNGPRGEKLVALTFDACQAAGKPAGYDRELIQILVETETPATLFLGGLWMQEHQLETQYLASISHFELGNHGWEHLNFSTATQEEMEVEIERTQDRMWELIGREPRVFRFPYGFYTEEALQVVNEHNLPAIQWDVVSGDPDPNVTADAMIPWVVDQVQPGSIVIMHMNERGWHTPEALPAIIEQLEAEGYTFVTVSGLLGLEEIP